MTAVISIPQSLWPTATETGPTYRIAYALFILVTATLFIRPAEIVESLEGLPIYNILIVACLIFAFPVVIRQLAWSALRRQPVVFCVVGLLPAVILSHLSHGQRRLAWDGSLDFGKTLLYFLLLTGLVNSARRLRSFLVTTVLLVSLIAALSLMQYHGVINIHAIEALDRREGIDESTGEVVVLTQIQGAGIFNDPNDFSIILVVGMVILAHFFMVAGSWPARVGWAALIGFLAYPFALTRSRGGFLSLLAALLVLIVSRLGVKRSIPIVLLVLPAMALLFAGRQTNIDLSNKEDTAMGRVYLWREGLMLMKASPVFGIGSGRYAEEAGQVAHNSFVHSFTELGLVGGTLFTAAFYLPISLLRRKDGLVAGAAGEVVTWRPTILALVVGYAIGLCSLTRAYAVSTYVILGLGAVYWQLLAASVPGSTPVLDRRLLKRIAIAGVCCLLFFYTFVRVMAR